MSDTNISCGARNAMAANNIRDYLNQQECNVDASAVALILETIGESFVLESCPADEAAKLENRINETVKRLLKTQSGLVRLYKAKQDYSVNDIIQELEKAKKLAMEIDSIGNQCADKIDFFIKEMRTINKSN